MLLFLVHRDFFEPKSLLHSWQSGGRSVVDHMQSMIHVDVVLSTPLFGAARAHYFVTQALLKGGNGKQFVWHGCSLLTSVDL